MAQCGTDHRPLPKSAKRGMPLPSLRNNKSLKEDSRQRGLITSSFSILFSRSGLVYCLFEVDMIYESGTSGKHDGLLGFCGCSLGVGCTALKSIDFSSATTARGLFYRLDNVSVRRIHEWHCD
jgi:hypothetical protein